MGPGRTSRAWYFHSPGFIYNFKDPIDLYNFKSEYYIALQFYIKNSKVKSNVFDYISKVIVIVIITFLQVL